MKNVHPHSMASHVLCRSFDERRPLAVVVVVVVVAVVAAVLLDVTKLCC